MRRRSLGLALRRRRRRRRAVLLGAWALLAVIVGLSVDATGALRRVELETVDARFAIRGDQSPPDDILVVGIDDLTFSTLSEQWPFRRSRHARVMRNLERAGARLIAYDVQFTEPSPDGFEAEDEALLRAVEKLGPKVVLATTEVDENGANRVLGDGNLVKALGARVGNAVMPADPSGVIRRVSFSVQGLESFAVAAAERSTGAQVDPSRFGPDGAWIDYHGKPGTLDYLSFAEVLERRFDPALVRGRTVVVGAVAPSLQDVKATSTSGDRLMSGPEIQAEAISTILRDFPLQGSAGWITVVLVLAAALAPAAASMRASPLRALMAALALGVVYAVAAQGLFALGVIVPLIVPLVTLAVATVGTLVVLYLLEAFERQRVRDAFAHFVPESVVDDVLAQADGELRLGGASREVTVLFSDLRGFTSFSESKPPDRVIEILNGYLSEMSDAIIDHGGTLISYMGDGIMAIFGAPLDQPDHRDRALATAREMLARLDRFNERMRDEGLSEGFRMGIGINSGHVMCGNVGSERRLEYTAIGDPVNTASRIEGMTKGTGYQVFVADSTRSGLRESADDLVFVDELPVRGREGRVRLWALAESVGDSEAVIVALRGSR